MKRRKFRKTQFLYVILHLTECNLHYKELGCEAGSGEREQWLHNFHTFKSVGHSSENMWQYDPQEDFQEELCTHYNTKYRSAPQITEQLNNCDSFLKLVCIKRIKTEHSQIKVVLCLYSEIHTVL
jgi:hypothetical protein